MTPEVISQSESSTQKQFSDLIIPQSVWVDFLNEIGYHRVRIMEIQFPKKIGVTKVKKLFSYLEKANDYYIQGDYNKAIGDCRDAIEDIPELHKLKSKNKFPSYSERVDHLIDDLLIKKTDKRIADHIRETLKTLWRFTSNFHHTQKQQQQQQPAPPPPIIANRADAEYIINQTLDLAVFVSKLFSGSK